MSVFNSAEYIHARTLPEHTKGLFTPASTDWLIRNRATNGLEQHIKKVNGKLYLNFPGFMTWFESHQA